MKRILTLLLALALLLPACAPNTPELPTKPVDSVAPPSAAPSDTVTPSPEAQDDESPDNPYVAIQEEPNLIEGEITITIFGDVMWGSYLKILAKKFPNVTITHHVYKNEYDYSTATAAEFMAGGGDDLVYVRNLPYQNYARQGMFVDLNQFLDKEPELREDFYSKVLDGYTVNGGLYALPQGVMLRGYWTEPMYSAEIDEYVGDKITMNYHDAIEAYETLKPDHSEMVCLSEHFTTRRILERELSRFYDYESKYVDFGTEFIKMLKDIAPYRADPSFKSQGNDMLFRLFLFLNNGNAGRLIPGVAERTIIAVDGEGSQLVNESDYTFAMNENCENKELAWEVMKFMTSSMAMCTIGDNMSLPARRSAMLPKIAQFNSPKEDNFHKVMEIIDTHMDDIDGITFTDVFLNELTDPLIDDYDNGLITAEELAQRLQDKLTIYVNQ